MILLLILVILDAPPTPRPRTNIDIAVNTGLDFLVRKQRADGSIVATTLNSKNIQAYTAFAGMAFISQGSTCKFGRYAPQLRKCVDYLLECQNAKGCFSDDYHQTYVHAFCIIFLCEIYGESHRDQDIKKAIARGTILICRTQGLDGGWRYSYPSADSDVTVTACQVLALRAARNTGFYIPHSVIEKAKKYIMLLQEPNGSFKYTINYKNRDSGLTACATLALNNIGLHYEKAVERARINLWKTEPPNSNRMYYRYYATAVAKQEGRERFEWWYNKISVELLKEMDKDSWSGEEDSVYCTAVACIILQSRNDFLPVFQE